MTTAFNGAVWLVAAGAWYLWRRRREVAAAGSRRLVLTPVATGVLLTLGVLSIAGLGARVAVGVVAPADFAQEAVGYRTWLAEGTMYPDDFPAAFRAWIASEPLPFEERLPLSVRRWRQSQLDATVPLYAVQAHPPPLVFAVAPLLAAVGSPGAFVALVLAGLAALVAAMRRLFRAVGPRWLPAPALVLVVVLGWQPILANVRHGQPGLLVAALVIAGFLALARGRDTSCGVCVGVATALKLFPGLLLVPLALRRPRAFLAACATLAVIWGAVTAVAGLAVWSAFATAAVRVAGLFGAAPNNFSLRSRLVGGLGEAGALLFVVLALAAVAVTLKRGSAAPDDQHGAEYAAFAVLALLLSPTCWSHYFVMALLPLMLLLQATAPAPSGRAVVGFVCVALALSLPDQVTWQAFGAVEAAAGTRAAQVATSLPTCALGALWVRLVQGMPRGMAPAAAA